MFKIDTSKIVCQSAKVVENYVSKIAEHKLANVNAPFLDWNVGKQLNSAVKKTIDWTVQSVCNPNEGFDINKLMLMFGLDSITYLGNKYLIVDAIGDFDVLDETASLRFEKNMLGKFSDRLKIKTSISNTAAISMNGLVNIRIRLKIDWSSGIPLVSIAAGDPSTATVWFNVDAQDSLKVNLGARSANLLNTNLKLEKVMAQISYSNDGGIGFKFGGRASFSTTFQIGDESCGIQAQINDIAAFFSQSSSDAVEITSVEIQSCAFLEEIIQKALDAMDLTKYLSDPSNMFGEFENAMEELWSKVFGPGGWVAMKVAVPLIDKLLRKYLRAQLDRIVGADAAKTIQAQLSLAASQALKTYSLDQIDPLLKENITLELLTGVFNKFLPLTTPTTLPKVGVYPYAWNLMLGANWSQIITDKLDIPLHIHGLLSFESNCALMLALNWSLPMRIEYQPDKGISISFGIFSDYIFRTDLNLEILPSAFSSTQCSMETDILLLGARFTPADSHLASASLMLRDSSHPSPFSLNVHADWDGDLKLGFAGSAVNKLNKDKRDSNDVFPHFLARYKLGFDYSWNSPITAPNFSLTSVEVCTGRLIAQVLRETISKLTGPFRPLGKFISKSDGVLRKVIPNTEKLFGGKMTIIDLLNLFSWIYNINLDGVIAAFEAFDNFER